MAFVKLKDIVGKSFTVEEVKGYKFKGWDNANQTMTVSDTWQDGLRKLYQVETEHGTLDLSESQLGSILEKAHHKGTSSLNGRAFTVKSNGKSGMDIRYFFQLAKSADNKPVTEEFEFSKDEEPW